MAEIQNSIYCTITDIGLRKSQEAAHNTGFFIQPVTFGVSQAKGIFSSSRTGAYPMWYQNKISSYQVIDSSTIAFYCDIPEDGYISENVINEVYLFAEDFEFNSFLFCLGQIDGLKYIPGTSIQLKIIINIVNFDTLSVYKFENTAIRDIEEHNNDPTAHAGLFADFLKNLSGGEIAVVSDNYKADIGEIIYCDTSGQSITLSLPRDKLKNGDTVTVIDHSGNANENVITISSYHSIEGTSENFIINKSGAGVTFRYNAKKNMWMVNLIGRLNSALPVGFNPNRNIYYSDYFTDCISVYNIYTDYRTNQLVAHNGRIYKANFSNNYTNIAIPGGSVVWEPINFGYQKISFYGAKKDVPKEIFQYVKGKNMLKVYIDGVLCNFETYQEDPEVMNGNLAKKIIFFDDIPNTFLIEVTL